MFKLALEKAEELPTSAGSWIKQESSRKNIYFCFIDYAKAFDCVDHNKLWNVYNGLLDSEGEGEGGMIWENGNSNIYTVM